MANTFKAIWPGARRGIGQARSAKEVCDVEGTPWFVEAKRQKRPSVLAAWAQATEATDGRPVLVVTRADQGPELVTMSMESFLKLMQPASSETSASTSPPLPEKNS